MTPKQTTAENMAATAPDSSTNTDTTANQHNDTNTEVSAEVILKMQERIAWLEANLGDTTNLIEELFTKIDKMERQIRYLASISEAPSAVRPLSEETPPPHY